MSESSKTTHRECELEYFERNNYFHGKLITPRDMVDEQAYHRAQLSTVTRDVLGSGIVSGLTVEIDSVEGEDIDLELSRGVAIDCCGTVVVVEEDASLTVTPDPVEADQYLYLRYDECKRETVPVPGGGDGCGGDCDYNRILEKFEVVAEPASTLPDSDVSALRGPHPVKEVEFPKRDNLLNPDGNPKSQADIDETDAELHRLAREYHSEHRDEYNSCKRPRIYLCRVTRNGGTWEIDNTSEPEADRGEYVYSNDLLYTAIARHTAAFDNPHDTSLVVSSKADELGAFVGVIGDDSNRSDVHFTSESDVEFTVDDTAKKVTLAVPRLGQIEGRVENNEADIDQNEADIDQNEADIDQNEADIDQNEADIDQNEADIDQLTTRVEWMERYIYDKTLKYKISCFEGVKEEFGEGFLHDLAEAIIERAEVGLDDRVYLTGEEFADFLVYPADEDETVVFENLDVEEVISGIKLTLKDDVEIEIDPSQYEGDISVEGDSLKVRLSLFGLEKLFGTVVARLIKENHVTTSRESRKPSYEEAMEELGKALESDDPIGMAVAQDMVCETAEWLKLPPQ